MSAAEATPMRATRAARGRRSAGARRQPAASAAGVLPPASAAGIRSGVAERRRLPPAAPQRGGVALATTLLLFFAVALASAYSHRSLLVEQRASASNVRATVAFEAAESGLEWAIAMLNSEQAVDADCRPSRAAGAMPLRERLLRYDAAAGQHLPRSQPTSSGGPAQPLRAACRRPSDGDGWRCSCPASGSPSLEAADGPAFLVELGAARPGLVQLTSDGCSGHGSPCAIGAERRAEALSRMQVTLALVGALRSRPLAPLTAGGSIDAGTAAVGLHNPDAQSAGWLLHAGGSAAVPAARLQTAPGGSVALALADGDAALRMLGGQRLFSRYFGLDKARWREQPGVRTVRCSGDCTSALGEALAAGPQRIWVEGDLLLAGPLTLGTPERPITVVGSGALRLEGALRLHGVLYGGSLRWDDVATGAAGVRGAVIVEGDYSGNGAPDLVYDAAVLARLQHATGSFVRLPGSWRDFQP